MTSLWTSLINHRDIRAGGSNRAVTQHEFSLSFVLRAERNASSGRLLRRQGAGCLLRDFRKTEFF